MYFPDSKLLVMHPTKTAGSTVEHFLMKELKDSLVPPFYLALQPLNDDSYHENHDKKIPILFGNYRAPGPLKGGFSLQHTCLVTARELLGEAVFDASRKVATVRDPYARVLSLYFYYGFAKTVSFPTFVVETLPNWERSSVSRAVNFAAKQVFYTHMHGAVAVDVIIRQEDLGPGMAALSDLLGREIPYDPKFRLRESRASKTFANYMDAYDDAARDVVRRLYADDFEVLGYKP